VTNAIISFLANRSLVTSHTQRLSRPPFARLLPTLIMFFSPQSVVLLCNTNLNDSGWQSCNDTCAPGEDKCLATSQTEKGGKMINTVEDNDGQWYMTWSVN
jgi:hypothetical protein